MIDERQFQILLQAATQWLKNTSPGIKRKYSRHDAISFVYCF
jgi:CRISPR/Cas system endoribonuclease Cas6 (RAMP superfamily)